jgi:2-amino-4-hydroxy-6-hydroxymethyldihydropteridine diphosphokinase
MANGHRAYLSAGSNLGDRERNLRDAIASLGRAGVVPVRVSDIIETEPVGLLEQPWFLNVAVEVITSLDPTGLLECCLEIERAHGRVRLVRGGPRTLDIDILLYDDAILNLPRLQIPHPRMSERRFVLEPMEQIAPDVINPATGQGIRIMLLQCPDRSTTRSYSAGGSP